MPFHEFFQDHWMHTQYRDLLERMSVMNSAGTISADEWEVASLYLVFAFVRDGPK
jgi:hypothetical protein